MEVILKVVEIMKMTATIISQVLLTWKSKSRPQRFLSMGIVKKFRETVYPVKRLQQFQKKTYFA